ncbi:4Fe-4S dicluster domain-containing protein [Roseibium aggregatum]|uniref:4Fe-4S dicluster domain-containing protein n=1 Tax=Roseibium aggregatum TaxID=187304 RepID=A0A926NXH2_9HYPH|nr:4Fe-4S dicluster domain-containing protein [Roseibium aggregatum]MBD1545450.1 4Fe-4S dicluster domain-containing protein [Roseibium aggregatum]
MTARTGGSFILDDPAPLVDALRADGWRVIGPREGDGAIVYDEIETAADLPRGFVDEQDGGHYRLRESGNDRWFDYVVGPQNWKKWLFPARQKLWSATRTADGFDIDPEKVEFPKTALFGTRACEIAAIEIQDRVFDNGDFADAGYRHRRENTLIVAVQCARSAPTCFCSSMNTGPRAEAGFDIALTELEDGGFFVECGSDRGAEILDRIDATAADAAAEEAAQAVTEQAAQMQMRSMPENIAGLLKDSLDHPRWAEVADRCLSCANCTLACPTCFCSDVEDVNDLSGDHTERWRVWDSCFSLDFSYIHGGAVRRSTLSRYRQWMTHKLSSWHDQFDTSGCVGCGRCITWCPVGIDITEEAAAFAAEPAEPADAGGLET